MSPYNLLIIGESGVGKELFAQAIHNESNRRNGPFVALNCATLPENLIESELFGYVSGAFTGASKGGQIGKFELADGGTLFLDEIGELPVQFQSKLLRALETRTITRLGGSKPTRVNVRIIAATNRDLKKMISEGFFREDLYYRLQVLNIVIPPLRERGRDVLLIANSILKQAVEYSDGEAKSLSPEAEKILTEYAWPGNIRELKNVIYRVSLLAKGDTVSGEDIEAAIYSKGYRLKQENPEGDAPQAAPPSPAPAQPDAEEDETIEEIKAGIDRSYARLIAKALRMSDGNKKQAADLLGISRRTIYRMIERYGL